MATIPEEVREAAQSAENAGQESAGGAAGEPEMAPPTLEQLQHWTRVVGLAQQMLLEHSLKMAHWTRGDPGSAEKYIDVIARMQTDTVDRGITFWQDMVNSFMGGGAPSKAERSEHDRRFTDPRWHENPVYSLIRQTYCLFSDMLLDAADSADGLDPFARDQLRFALKGIIDAASPTNSPFFNPQVIERTIETNGENLIIGLERILADMERGQLSQTDRNAFRLGDNIASTPGKVIAETPLYQLIQYSPTTKSVYETPLVIFPPWINRYYILDLSEKKSFVRWAVDQGLTVFMVSWKSADASMADVSWDDYILRGQISAIDTVRDLLGVESVHTIGYCVAGTTLAATLAYLAAAGRADIVKSATFFTAQVDFSEAGELKLFVDDSQIKLVESLTESGFLDGRYLAATFNLLRGRDLIWSYVVNNYLLAQDYMPFDLLYWNSDSTNLPGKWLIGYLSDLYRDNKLVQAGAMQIGDKPIDLSTIITPCYVQAGIEDHIAPAASVWKILDHLTCPSRFVLAGSGHIAGVVNPPSSNKYQYWTCADPVSSLHEFRDKAVETKGSWWPDWINWIDEQAPEKVPATKGRKPGKGKLPAIEDAPGRYASGH